jgi:hypothetical protein
MITHGTPAAPDASPNLLKISESAFCGGLREAAQDRPAAGSPRTARGEGVVDYRFMLAAAHLSFLGQVGWEYE